MNASQVIFFLLRQNPLTRWSSTLLWWLRGLRVHPSAKITASGQFQFGSSCTIRERSEIYVAGGGALVLGSRIWLAPDVVIDVSHHKQNIGTGTTIQSRTRLIGDIVIGRYCTIAPNVFMSSGQHHFAIDPALYIRQQDRRVRNEDEFRNLRSRPIVIGDDCWIGVNAVILPGVHIGKGAVVGANSVVTKDVVPYSVVVGAPAKAVKKRLEFVPPPSLVADHPGSFPYLMKGFDHSSEALMGAVKAHGGGVFVDRQFEVALAKGRYRSLHVEARNPGANITIEHEGESHVISESNPIATFAVDGLSERYLFLVRAMPATAHLCISRIWLT